MFKKIISSLILNMALLMNTATVSAADRTLAIAFTPANATVAIHTSSSPDVWVSKVDDNGDGYVTFQIDDSLGDSDIKIEAAGFRPYQVHFKFRNERDNASDPRPLNQQVNVGQDIPALLPAAPPLPPPGVLPTLGIIGPNFVDAQGRRQVLLGTDQFVAFKMFLDGNLSGLSALFQESRELGFNMWRVFMQGSVVQNNILQLSPNEPGYYEHVRPFADLLNRQGIVLLATVYVDNQDIKAPNPQHWQRVADLLRGSTTILSGGNEWRKNGFDPGLLTDPGMLWSRGSDLGDQAPFKPTGLIMEFHPRRDLPAMLLDSVASPVTIYGSLGYPPIPLLIDEGIGFAVVPRPGSRSNDPWLAYKLARHYSTETAGTVFHNDAGMRGQLMPPEIRACAVAWLVGMRLQ